MRIEGGKMKKKDSNKLEVEIIINGISAGYMSFPEGIALVGLRAQVLAKTKNIGQPPENWNITDPAGTILDLGNHLMDYADLDQLWFSLKAGVGGY